METLDEGQSELHLCALRADWSQHGSLEPGKLEVRDRFGRTPLFFCVMLGDSHGAQMLLRAGARPDHSDHAGQTPLHLAARKAHRSLVRLLLSAGAPWARGDVHGCTPLHCVATVALPQARTVLTMLLECMDASQVDLQDKLKQTALHRSARACHSENMLMLLRKGANPLMQDMDGRTALHLCVASSHPAALECTRLLLDAEPSLTSWQDYHGCTPLHLAVASGSMAVIDLLTQRSNSEVNALDDLFRTPLHWAAILGRLEVGRLLLERCAGASLADRAGATPLDYACSSDEAGMLVAMLLSHHHAVESVDTALNDAALAGNVAAVRALYYYEVHPEASHAAMVAAASRGHLEVLQLMLDVCGGSAPQQPSNQLSPLMAAACGGHGSCVLALLDVGASTHAVDAGGRTALHWATVGQQATICRLLIQRGCRVDASDNYGNLWANQSTNPSLKHLGHLTLDAGVQHYTMPVVGAQPSVPVSCFKRMPIQTSLTHRCLSRCHHCLFQQLHFEACSHRADSCLVATVMSGVNGSLTKQEQDIYFAFLAFYVLREDVMA
ncbi:uncharacterized protein LOC119178128 isoform X11 [Rhipicephalus microplus]|uniref:uncharacterized protein LOC119178128 isoform X11 n=1 Tax=Rhipicephalus microplus TaxID=6941 RepID=UPI003F6D5887